MRSFFSLLILVFTLTDISAQRKYVKPEFVKNWSKPGKRPDHIVLNFSEDPATSISVTWRTSKDVMSGYGEIAKAHARKVEININYICTSPEKVNESYDVILCMEIVEHVDNLKLFYQSCVNLLNKNGLIFFATINQTVKSYLLAIVGAEYILRWLPIGTHDWKKFVKPTHMIDSISNLSLNYKKITTTEEKE